MTHTHRQTNTQTNKHTNHQYYKLCWLQAAVEIKIVYEHTEQMSPSSEGDGLPVSHLGLIPTTIYVSHWCIGNQTPENIPPYISRHLLWALRRQDNLLYLRWCCCISTSMISDKQRPNKENVALALALQHNRNRELKHSWP